MTLLERIEDLKRRAQDQLGRQAGRDEAGKLQPLLKEANACLLYTSPSPRDS